MKETNHIKQMIKSAPNPHEALYNYLLFKARFSYKEKGDDNKIQKIAENLKNGTYHDFITNETMPKVKLFRDLSEVGFQDLAELVQEGVFDEDVHTNWSNIKDF